MLAQRGGGSGHDSDKLNPTHVTSSRAPSHFDHRSRNDDDDDKLLDVVGPPQSPLLPLGHSLSQFNTSSHAGKFCFSKAKKKFYKKKIIVCFLI